MGTMRLLMLAVAACAALAAPGYGQEKSIPVGGADGPERLISAGTANGREAVMPGTLTAVIAGDTLSRPQPDAVKDAPTPDAVLAVLVRAQPAGVSTDVASPRRALGAVADQDTVRRRAVQYSEWYSRRLTIHRYGSYTMLPLFVTQFVLGSRLLGQKEDLYAGTRLTPVDSRLRSTHAVVSGAVGTLFAVNTTTGLWNLFESRHNPEGRTRRTVHALTMLAADAGFVYTGVLGSRATDRGPPQGRRHRNTALASFSVATAGASLMWFGR